MSELRKGVGYRVRTKQVFGADDSGEEENLMPRRFLCFPGLLRSLKSSVFCFLNSSISIIISLNCKFKSKI